MPKRASSLSSDLDLDLPLPGFQNGVSSRGRKVLFWCPIDCACLFWCPVDCACLFHVWPQHLALQHWCRLPQLMLLLSDCQIRITLHMAELGYPCCGSDAAPLVSQESGLVQSRSAPHSLPCHCRGHTGPTPGPSSSDTSLQACRRGCRAHVSLVSRSYPGSGGMTAWSLPPRQLRDLAYPPDPPVGPASPRTPCQRMTRTWCTPPAPATGGPASVWAVMPAWLHACNAHFLLLGRLLVSACCPGLACGAACCLPF